VPGTDRASSVGPSAGDGPGARPWRVRFAWAAGVGTVVTALALCAGWLTAGPMYHLGDRQAMTRTVISYHAQWLDILGERGEPLPETLGELVRIEQKGDGGDDVRLYAFDRRTYEASLYTPLEKWHVDQWGRPFRYEVEGDRYEIVSLGRDGEEGGRGFDRDLSSEDPSWAPRLPTPWDFLFHQPSGGARDTALLAGALSAAATLLLGVTGRRERNGRGCCLGWIVLGSVLMTGLLAELHVPYVSGH